MLEKQIVKSLVDIVGPENLAVDRQSLICYGYDATQTEFLPQAVIHPAGPEEVSSILKLANREGLAVFPRGAGSGFSGGSLAKGGGLVLVTTRMKRILRIDSDNLIAEVEPGVITGAFQEEVRKLGLFYPPDPASLKFSTLGGNVAECAGGPHAVKYGVTRDYVMGLEVVLPTGEIIRTGGETYKGVVGYDLTRLVVGSEGTLGVITKIILKLLPLPESRKTMLAVFDSIGAAAVAVSTMIGGKIIPATLEFMDHTAIQCVRRRFELDIPVEAKAILLIEVDGDADLVNKQARRMQEMIPSTGLLQFRSAQDEAEAEHLWKVRRLVSPSLRDVNPDKYNEDIVVPRSKVPDILSRIDQIQKRYDIPIVNFGHAGDGNIHVNILIDKRVPGMEARAQEAIREIFRETLALHGSISGEHGIGLSKQAFLSMELKAEQITAMQAIKRALDPNHILNPGKIFPIPGPPLPPAEG